MKSKEELKREIEFHGKRIKDLEPLIENVKTQIQEHKDFIKMYTNQLNNEKNNNTIP